MNFISKTMATLLAAFVTIVPCTSAVQGEVPWSAGPDTLQLGSQASVDVPSGHSFIGDRDTQNFMRMLGNTVSGNEVGCFGPTEDDWFVVCEFDPVGFVKDDEGDELDPEDLLDSIKAGTEAANEMRASQGIPPLNIVGWETEPRYDASTHNLEWAVRAQSQGQPLINHQIRILGREGVMEITIVCGPEQLRGAVDETKSIMSSFEYKEGMRYSQFVPGDKIAKYGLAALVAGGAAAVALKTGLLGKLLKPLMYGLVAVGLFFKKIFSGMFGKSESDNYMHQ